MGEVEPQKFWNDYAYIIKDGKITARLPHLARLGSVYLGATASSGTAERSFKVSSDMWTKRRNQLGKQTLEKLIYVYFNRLHLSLTRTEEATILDALRAVKVEA